MVLLGWVFGDHIVCLFSKHSCSVHFFLFNEFNDDESDCSMAFEFEVGERCLASENERLTVFCLLSSCSSWL